MINHLPNRTDFVPIIPVTPEQIEVGQLVTLQAADVQRREGDRLMQAQRAEKKRRNYAFYKA